MEDERGIFQSPRVAISIFIALCIVAAAFFSTYTPNTYLRNDVSVADVVPAGTHQDLDSDGLETWQEELWKTDPNNADSDGDGTPDGEEVRIGRDPRTKGPNDRKEYAVTATSTRSPYYDDDPTLTTTDIIGRDLFSGAAALEQSGELSDENIGLLIDSLVLKARKRMPQINTQYSLNDIHVSPVDTPEVFRAYFNGLATIALADTEQLSKEELLLLWTSPSVDQRLPLAQRETSREKALIQKLLPLIPPAELAKHHLTLINTLADNVFILDRVGNASVVNPIEDLLLLQEFQARTETMGKTIEALFATPMLQTIPWTDADAAVKLLEGRSP